eukprot:scaffold9397_cov148-Isochrysis_galbana.AAC.3
MAHQSLGPSYHRSSTTQEQSTGPPTNAGTNSNHPPTWETHPQTITRRSTKSKLTTHDQDHQGRLAHTTWAL